MTMLTVFNDTDPSAVLKQTSDVAVIRDALDEIGIRFEQWSTPHAIADDATPDDVLAAYEGDIDRLKAEGGYQAADVISLTEDNPAKDELRKKFLDEHTHSEDEVRFFVRGNGLFYLHKAGKVFAVLCEQGDLISVPANTTHWFDMGSRPNFTAIRLFTNPEGWVAGFTGDAIASRFPKYEDLVN
ncbi:MAG: cupin [Ketobacteraceae bacterium]|nr:cupin [Ketobacteraceae bacterium]